MAKVMVMQYLFIVDDSVGWTNGYEFENFLKKAMVPQKLRGEVVNADGNAGLRVIHISTIDPMELVNNTNHPPEKKGK